MNVLTQKPFIGFQEVPGEISAIWSFTGCPFHCDGCHSKELWDKENGFPFYESWFRESLSLYKEKVSCICFFGGEWNKNVLHLMIKESRLAGYKVAMYSAYEKITDLPEHIVNNLDYIKVGPYIQSLGGLADKTTNQRFYKKIDKNWTDITSEFWKD